MRSSTAQAFYVSDQSEYLSRAMPITSPILENPLEREWDYDAFTSTD